jgi:hypothetical protein
MTLENILKKRLGGYDRFNVMQWLINGQRSINKNEQMSILSLLAYTAVETDTPVEEMHHAFLEAFHLTRIEQMKGNDYEDAVRFVMEWKSHEQGKANPDQAVA